MKRPAATSAAVIATGLGALATWWGTRGRRNGNGTRVDLPAAVLDHLPAGVSVAEAPSGQILYHNDEATRLLRHPLREAADVGGYSRYGAHHGRDRDRPYEPEEYPLARALSGEVVKAATVDYLRGDDSWTTFEVNAAPVRSSDGRIVAAVSTFRDVQRLVNAERALREATDQADQARREAEDANRAKSQFLAVMSHEVRTPLNAILGYGDLLLDGVMGAMEESQRSYLERIKASGQHLLVLVNDVLDLAKIEAGELRIERQRVLVESVARDAMAVVTPLIEGEGLAVSSGTDVHPVLEVWGDEGRIRQVLVNLLSNAVKFTESGEVRLRSHVRAGRPSGITAPHPGPWVGLEVADTGIGIPHDRQAEVFEPFVQAVDDVYSRTHEGTGLGLSISRRLARMMGGDIVLESVPGEGSSFTLWLPAVRGVDPRPPERRVRADRRSGPADRRRGDRRVRG
jgi:signal transduction histidine kinase